MVQIYCVPKYSSILFPRFVVFDCGEVLRNTTGMMSYKLLHSDENNSEVPLNCTWVILAENYTNQVVELTFLYMNIPLSESCELGSVQVFDN